MTSNQKHFSYRSTKGRHKATLDAYIGADHHRIDERHVKTIRQIAKETDMDPASVRRCLKRDHREEYLRCWPNAELLIAKADRGRTQRGSLSLPISGDLPKPDTDEIAAAMERL